MHTVVFLCKSYFQLYESVTYIFWGIQNLVFYLVMEAIASSVSQYLSISRIHVYFKTEKRKIPLISLPDNSRRVSRCMLHYYCCCSEPLSSLWKEIESGQYKWVTINEVRVRRREKHNLEFFEKVKYLQKRQESACASRELQQKFLNKVMRNKICRCCIKQNTEAIKVVLSQIFNLPYKSSIKLLFKYLSFSSFQLQPNDFFPTPYLT